MLGRTTLLIAMCVLGAASAAMAAPRHHHAADRAARHRAAIGAEAPARAFAPCAAYAYGCQGPTSAEELWFRRAKGNIWGG